MFDVQSVHRVSASLIIKKPSHFGVVSPEGSGFRGKEEHSGFDFVDAMRYRDHCKFYKFLIEYQKETIHEFGTVSTQALHRRLYAD